MKLFQKYFKKLAEETTKEVDKDITFPESKEKITLKALKENLSDIEDVAITEMTVGGENAYLIYMQSMVVKDILVEMVLKPLGKIKKADQKELLQIAVEVEKDNLYELLYDIASGYTVLFFENKNNTFKINTISPPSRNISSPLNETTVMGPSDAFTESLEINLGLVKKRISNTNLKIKNIILGTETRNQVSVLYMKNIVNEENLRLVFKRLNNVEYQGFLDISVLKQMMEDHPYSLFPQLGLTVRPDNAVSALLSGRIIVLMNNSPEAMILPISFFEMFSSPDDYYNRWTTATVLRFLRFGGFFITIALTPTYISILTYHPEMLPPDILGLLFQSRLRVPFPPFLEVLLIEIVIEVLREAGARMPSKIGNTIGIVGGIVIGTAAVEAGLASNVLIVMVAISALLSFMPPTFLMSNAARNIRYIFIFAAGIFGLYGQMLAFAWLIAHLLNLTSLGTPYMTPIIPRAYPDLLDSVFRAPIKFIFKRKGISRAQKDLKRPLDEE